MCIGYETTVQTCNLAVWWLTMIVVAIRHYVVILRGLLVALLDRAHKKGEVANLYLKQAQAHRKGTAATTEDMYSHYNVSVTRTRTAPMPPSHGC